MLRTRTSQWMAGTVAVCVLLLVGTWFLLVGPRRAQAEELGAEREQAQSTNHQLELDIQQLKADSLTLPARQADMAKLKQQFPDAVLLPRLIRDLNTMAIQAGVSLDSLTPGTPVAVSAQATTPTPTAAAGSGGSPAAAAGRPALLQVPVTMNLTGDYFQVAAFVKRLQGMQRLILISSVQMSADAKGGGGSVMTTLTGQVYVLPDEDTVVAGGSPASTSPPGTPGNLGGGTPSVAPQVQTTAPQRP